MSIREIGKRNIIFCQAPLVEYCLIELTNESRMSYHCSFWISCCSWSITEQVNRIRSRLWNFYLEITFSKIYNFWISVNLNIKILSSFNIILSQWIKCHNVFHWLNPCLSQLHKILKACEVTAHCLKFTLINDLTKCLLTKRIKERNYCHITSYAIQVTYSKFFSVLSIYSQKPEHLSINILLWRKIQILSS